MSQEGARAYVERVTSDEAFRNQVAAAPDPEARRQLVEAAGFDVEPADQETIRAALGEGSMELTDEELAGVSGGGYGLISAIGNLFGL
jgi:predicted ribosomally synthesized peptide with nif11-like leader